MQVCVMTWETFLKMFKSNYSFFYYNGVNWTVKNTDLKIILHFNNSIIEDNKIIFLNEKELLNFGIL